MKLDATTKTTADAIKPIQRYIERTCRPPKEVENLYQLRSDDLCALYDFAQESILDAMILAFEYGRAKAYRSIENTQKKAEL